MTTDFPSAAALRVWALLDDRAGNRSQVMGVAETLGLPFEQKALSYRSLAALPNTVIGANAIGLRSQSRRNLSAPWPHVVIAAGRRTSPVARWIKRHADTNPVLVQIMNPGGNLRDFDVLAIPSHDTFNGVPSSNTVVIRYVGAPHRFTSSVLRSAAVEWAETFDRFPTPKIAVIVGGSTKRRQFTTAMARELGQIARQWAEQSKGSLLITTSRRTSRDAAIALLDEVKSVRHFVHCWGDAGENPYVGMLALADHIIVTGESVSMCAETAAAGKPVSIFAPDGLIGDKHRRLHHALFAAGHAHPIGAGTSVPAGPGLNSAEEIVSIMQEMFTRRCLSSEA